MDPQNIRDSMRNMQKENPTNTLYNGIERFRRLGKAGKKLARAIAGGFAATSRAASDIFSAIREGGMSEGMNAAKKDLPGVLNSAKDEIRAAGGVADAGIGAARSINEAGSTIQPVEGGVRADSYATTDLESGIRRLLLTKQTISIGAGALRRLPGDAGLVRTALGPAREGREDALRNLGLKRDPYLNPER